MFSKVTGKTVDCPVCPVRLAMFCLKMKNWPDNLILMTNINCFYSCYVTMQIVFYFGVNKYETYKYFSTTFCVVESYTVLSH